MAGPSNKRQKREAYRRQMSEAQKKQEPNDPEAAEEDAEPPRPDGKQSLSTGKKIEMPKKRFYRQRAHANVFSDHNLV